MKTKSRRRFPTATLAAVILSASFAGCGSAPTITIGADESYYNAGPQGAISLVKSGDDLMLAFAGRKLRFLLSPGGTRWPMDKVRIIDTNVWNPQPYINGCNHGMGPVSLEAWEDHVLAAYVQTNVSYPKNPGTCGIRWNLHFALSRDRGATWGKEDRGIVDDASFVWSASAKKSGNMLCIAYCNVGEYFSFQNDQWKSDLRVATSKDMGKTWKVRIINKDSGFCQHVEAAAPAEGALCVAYAVKGALKLAVTIDGGETWDHSTAASNAFSVMALDARGDDICILYWTNNTHNDAISNDNTMNFVRSSDGGKTWGPPRFIDADQIVAATVWPPERSGLPDTIMSGYMGYTTKGKTFIKIATSSDQGKTWKRHEPLYYKDIIVHWNNKPALTLSKGKDSLIIAYMENDKTSFQKLKVASHGIDALIKSPEKLPQYVVCAENGLFMRDKPSIKGKTLALIPSGESVSLLYETLEKEAVADVEGKWSVVDWKGTAGWVFGGHLSPQGKR